jgi:uncharacterized lipoprotein YajG
VEIDKISSSMVLIAALLASAGCKAYIPQQANIAPSVTVVSSSEVTGVAVAVRVTDERPSKSLGRRGTELGMPRRLLPLKTWQRSYRKRLLMA